MDPLQVSIPLCLKNHCVICFRAGTFYLHILAKKQILFFSVYVWVFAYVHALYICQCMWKPEMKRECPSFFLFAYLFMCFYLHIVDIRERESVCVCAWCMCICVLVLCRHQYMYLFRWACVPMHPKVDVRFPWVLSLVQWGKVSGYPRGHHFS